MPGTKSVIGQANSKAIDLGRMTFKRWLGYLKAQNTPEARASLGLPREALEGAFVAGFVAGAASVYQPTRR